MKVDRPSKPPTFRPIVITLESRDELRVLFHMANCSPFVQLEKYYQNGDATQAELDRSLKIKGRLQESLSSYYYHGGE